MTDLRPPSWARGILWLSFGLLCAAFVQALAGFLSPGVSRLCLLVLASSLAALVVAGAWFVVLGIRAGPAWGFAFCAGIWIPYLNMLLAWYFARRYWYQGARAPALLGIGAFAGQTIGSWLLLFPNPPVLL